MSMRYKGAVLSATAPTTSSSSAKGIWTMRQQLQAVGGTGWPNALIIPATFLVIAGGGAGGFNVAGGGGAGGYRSSVSGEPSGGGASAESILNLTPAVSYTVTVGAGGAGGDWCRHWSN